MDIAAFRTGLKAFREEVGPRCEVYVSVRDDGECFNAALYANGISSRKTDLDFRIAGETFVEVLSNLKSKWAEFSEDHKQRTIRKMALAIIRITAELGECTDAALRASNEFDPGQIARFGQQACEDANDIAGRGPFCITVMGGANSEAA